ncbi:MAG: hypothetical protein R2856_15770 [Caldilineaceae bacterium]
MDSGEPSPPDRPGTRRWTWKGLEPSEVNSRAEASIFGHVIPLPQQT